MEKVSSVTPVRVRGSALQRRTLLADPLSFSSVDRPNVAGLLLRKIFHQVSGGEKKKAFDATWPCHRSFFVALRATNMYGDAQHWTAQKNVLFTLMSFVNTVKYPPSLLYMCMTIGPAILLVAQWESVKNKLTRFIIVYGRVPFFYYVLHFTLIHILSTAAFFMRGHYFSEGLQAGKAPLAINFLIPGEGYDLWVVYLMWIFVFVSLYPLCKKFSEYKQTHKQWWLSYL